ncbi:MAG: hypothetical protein HGA85_08875, partial [Nanoarchaeota archaeon]|nr:hypothetical protein [Nanoarchaeota archaeon]
TVLGTLYDADVVHAGPPQPPTETPPTETPPPPEPPDDPPKKQDRGYEESASIYSFLSTIFHNKYVAIGAAVAPPIVTALLAPVLTYQLVTGRSDLERAVDAAKMSDSKPEAILAAAKSFFSEEAYAAFMADKRQEHVFNMYNSAFGGGASISYDSALEKVLITSKAAKLLPEEKRAGYLQSRASWTGEYMDQALVLASERVKLGRFTKSVEQGAVTNDADFWLGEQGVLTQYNSMKRKKGNREAKAALLQSVMEKYHTTFTAAKLSKMTAAYVSPQA